MTPFALKKHDQTNSSLRPLIDAEIKSVFGGNPFGNTSDSINTYVYTGQAGQPTQDDGTQEDE